MTKNAKTAVVASIEVPATEVQSIESVMGVLAPAKRKRRHSKSNKASRTNIVHVTKTNVVVLKMDGKIVTPEVFNTQFNGTQEVSRTSTTKTNYRLLTTIESNSPKDFTLQLAKYFAGAPIDVNVKDIIYTKVSK